MKFTIIVIALLAATCTAKPVNLQITFPPPVVVPSPPPPAFLTSPPPPSPPPVPTFPAPGIDFSINVLGYTTTTWTAAQSAALCNAVTSGLIYNSATPVCTVGSVNAFNGTAGVQVNGYAYFQFPTVPTIFDLQTASAIRDARIITLTSNSTFISSSFPGASVNCACYGPSTPVTQSSALPFNYAVNLTGIPGPTQCGARLIYDSISINNAINIVGVDDGSTVTANLGKYCSTPAVTGGIVGIPGSGSCRQYGVLASAGSSLTATAIATITTGSITAVALTGPNGGGSGYSSIPTVTVSAPSPLAVQVVYTLSSVGYPAGSIVSATNGPYTGTPSVTSITGATCVDTTNTGTTGGNGHCNGPQTSVIVAGTVQSGAICQAGDLTAVTVGANGAVTSAPMFPLGALCTHIPTVTLGTTPLQQPVQAVINAAIDNSGVVTALFVVNPGSGYTSAPTITIAAPTSNSIGKLCGPAPIPNLPSSIAYGTPVGISVNGQCVPMGIDTQLNQVCSIPAAPGGIYYAPGTNTCNVVSSFIAQPGTTVQNTCAVVPQVFTSTVAPSPAPAPAPAPAHSPPPPPVSSPPPPPSPVSSPPPPPSSMTCNYNGVYFIESLACPGKFIAYFNNPRSHVACNKNTVLLRTAHQSNPPRRSWKLSATATTGISPAPSPITAIGRLSGRGCPHNKYFNLAAANNGRTVLGGSAWVNRIIPVDASQDCNTVWIQAVSGNASNNKYLGYGSCSSQTAFTWSDASQSTALQWRLTPVNYG